MDQLLTEAFKRVARLRPLHGQLFACVCNQIELHSLSIFKSMALMFILKGECYMKSLVCQNFQGKDSQHLGTCYCTLLIDVTEENNAPMDQPKGRTASI
jgi:hypothetical protein